MAQLSKEKAQKTAEAESSSFEPIPNGAYHAKLVDVDSDREGAKGPYWSWEYEVVGEEHSGRKLWNNTSLADNAAWKLKETFEAFGVETDTDTDDLIGRVVKLVVSTRTIEQGARKGELANQVDRVEPADEDAPEGGSGGGDSEDIFSE